MMRSTPFKWSLTPLADVTNSGACTCVNPSAVLNLSSNVAFTTVIACCFAFILLVAVVVMFSSSNCGILGRSNRKKPSNPMDYGTEGFKLRGATQISRRIYSLFRDEHLVVPITGNIPATSTCKAFG